MVLRRVLRLAAVVALAVSAWVHLVLAPVHARDAPAISLGHLFYVQGALAAAVAVWLLVQDRPAPWLAGLVLMAASLVAVLQSVTAQVDLPGPLPVLYEPLWYFRKTLSAVAEAAYVVLWLLQAVQRRSGSRVAR